MNIFSWKVKLGCDSAVFARAQLTRVERNYGLSTGVCIGCVHQAAKGGDDGEDAAPSVTITQAFAMAGTKDAKRTEARQKAAGEDEGSAEGDAEETQIKPFEQDIQGVEDDTAT